MLNKVTLARGLKLSIDGRTLLITSKEERRDPEIREENWTQHPSG